jgi:hypothetical protein
MKLWRRGFNHYLVAALLLGAAGCSTTDKEDAPPLTSLSVHLEAGSAEAGQSGSVRILRSRPLSINIQFRPFLTQDHVVKADLHDSFGTHDIALHLNREGQLILHNTLRANPGMRIAYFCQFGQEEEGRWLAAPRYDPREVQDVLVFTPDASRDESVRVVLGLNQLARKAGRKL